MARLIDSEPVVGFNVALGSGLSFAPGGGWLRLAVLLRLNGFPRSQSAVDSRRRPVMRRHVVQ